MKSKAHLLPCTAKGQGSDKSPYSDHTGCDSPLSGHLLSLSVSVSAWDSAEEPRKGKEKKRYKTNSHRASHSKFIKRTHDLTMFDISWPISVVFSSSKDLRVGDEDHISFFRSTASNITSPHLSEIYLSRNTRDLNYRKTLKLKLWKLKEIKLFLKTQEWKTLKYYDNSAEVFNTNNEEKILRTDRPFTILKTKRSMLHILKTISNHDLSFPHRHCNLRQINLWHSVRGPSPQRLKTQENCQVVIILFPEPVLRRQ